MKMLKRVAAAVCGAATLFALGATAMSASADATAEISVEKVTIKMDQVNDWIPVSMSIQNNPGYAASGLSYLYDVEGDFALDSQPLYDEDEEEYKDTLAQYEAGAACRDLSVYVNRNAEKGIVGFSSTGMSNNKKNDVIITAYFKIADPSKAEPGKVYPIRMNIIQFCNKNSEDLPATAVDGYIMIEEEQTTSSDTTTSSETTTTSTETSATETSATQSSATESSASVATTTTSAAAATTTTTAAAATTTSTAKPSQTGDAGVGVVVATLIAAAGAAVVLRKKED